MSQVLRWMLTFAAACALLALVFGLGMLGFVALAFASDSCSAVVGGPSVPLLIGSPGAIAVGVVAGSVMAGLNKPTRQWLKVAALWVALGIAGYAAWGVSVVVRCS